MATHMQDMDKQNCREEKGGRDGEREKEWGKEREGGKEETELGTQNRKQACSVFSFSLSITLRVSLHLLSSQSLVTCQTHYVLTTQK